MRNPPNSPRRHQDYTVAIICAIGFERDAVRYMLDHEHPRLAPRQGDSNLYILGELSGHNVALACLPGSQGKGAAATVATNMDRTFLAIKWRFLIGIGGGVPSDKHDVRLGDVVVGMPEGPCGGVVQYDLGKDTVDNFQLKGFLSPPPSLLRSAVELMPSDHLTAENKVENFLLQLLQKGPRLAKYQRPSAGQDVLFDADYPHVESRSACENCDRTKTISRAPRQFPGPELHYGLIASGDRVMRCAAKRNMAAGIVGNILCFEMEAAGIATEFPCIVIRGISDYADSHKNDSWQHYAAAAAAATAKELLLYIDTELDFSNPHKLTHSQHFETDDGCRAHLVESDKGRCIDAELAKLLNGGKKAMEPLFSSCSLCDGTAQNVNGKLEQHIARHLARHLRLLALKTLPHFPVQNHHHQQAQQPPRAMVQMPSVRRMNSQPVHRHPRPQQPLMGGAALPIPPPSAGDMPVGIQPLGGQRAGSRLEDTGGQDHKGDPANRGVVPPAGKGFKLYFGSPRDSRSSFTSDDGWESEGWVSEGSEYVTTEESLGSNSRRSHGGRERGYGRHRRARSESFGLDLPRHSKRDVSYISTGMSSRGPTSFGPKALAPVVDVDKLVEQAYQEGRDNAAIRKQLPLKIIQAPPFFRCTSDHEARERLFADDLDRTRDDLYRIRLDDTRHSRDVRPLQDALYKQQ